MTDTGVASDKPLENEIQQRLKKFQNLNKLKRQALKLIASYMPPDEVQGLRNQFHALDKDGNGAASICSGKSSSQHDPVSMAPRIPFTRDLSGQRCVSVPHTHKLDWSLFRCIVDGGRSSS